MKPFAHFLIVVLFLIPFKSSVAQEVRILEGPENYQLYARDHADSASVAVQGMIKKGVTFNSVKLKVFKDGELYSTQECALENNRFFANSRIYAGLHEFRFELQVNNGIKDSLIAIADSVVCGDAFIITGQSNSHASSIYSNYSSPWCRSFGVKTGYEAYNDADKKVRWGRATGNCEGLTRGGGWFMKNKFGVGAWGMELMRLIVEKHKVPVCFINGGSGSSSIEENMLSTPEKASLETSFGRLAYRVDQAGLKDKVKAIFWHQGETNSNHQQDESIPEDNYRIYSENFDILFHDWRQVYTGLEKVYLFQLHPGCGGDYQSEMREIQTQIAERYNMIEIMSTNGIAGHEGCHFSYEGYCGFARCILPLVSRDFYNEKPAGIITPPKLLNATYSEAGEITLQFDQPIVMEDKLEVKGTTHAIKDQFFFGSDRTPNLVNEAMAQGDKIVLKMKGHAVYDLITYLPNRYYLNTNQVYEGPWIFGENGLGALSFDKRKITVSESIGIQPQWKGYDLLDSTLNGVNFKIVFPKRANKNRNWIWRARFWGHEPQTDLALLEQGFHLVYIEVGGLFGSPKATKIWDEFYAFATQKYQLNKKVVLEGMSRGGLIIFNWANQNADKVACIYGDAPVCDFKSWPLGNGIGEGSAADWKTCLEQYEFTREQALAFQGNPINHMENIAKEKIPVLNVVGDADKVVPFAENTYLLKKRLNELGWDLTVIHKPNVGHHPHSLKDPKPIVDFILMNTGNKDKKVSAVPEWSMNNVRGRSDFRNCKIQFEQNKTGHVAFFGGSITEMDGYRPLLCTFLENKFPSTEFTFTNAGIASTGSTTGAFRMDRDVLEEGPLDLLFLEFAVNDDQDEAHSYDEAVLGMEAIIRKARKHNPNVDIVMTYFVNPEILKDYQQGLVRTSIAAHEAVAQHYNISTCNLAKEVADQITIGTLNWETFGGTHPHPFGNQICAGMISSMLEKAWNSKVAFEKPAAINAFNFENGRLVDPSSCEFDRKWSYAVPAWEVIKGSKRDRFLNSKMLCTTKKGAELTFNFSGTAVGAFILAGPDAGVVEVSMDGGPFKEHDLYHSQYSKGLHYPRTVMFATDLSKGKHTMNLRMSKTSSGNGTAARIMNFVVNEF